MITFDAFAFKLSSGAHPKGPQSGTCFMEAVAWMADERHSDAPACACPVLGRFGIRLNDRMTDDERKLLNPLILKMINTHSPAHMKMRAEHLLRGVATRTLPVIFDLRGRHDLAATLRAIPEGATFKEMLPALQKVKKAAYADAYAYADADAAAYAYAVAYAAADAAAYAYAVAYAYARQSPIWQETYAKYRAQFIQTSVDLLNEAIELGPHTGDEFYDVRRVVEFREKVLQRA